MSDRLLVFVKAPRPGEVKTRLARDVGAEPAAALHRAMAARVLERTRPPSGSYTRVVFHAPPDAEAEVARWLPGETLVPQSPGDLGARMAAAFEWAFAGGAARVVLIGTDTPDLAAADIVSALEALRASDVVVGPSLDGGYYLVGLARPCPGIFADISWSTPAVLGETLARAEALDLKVAPRPVRGDIDTLEDLRREWPRLRDWLPADLARGLEPIVGENDRP